MHSNPEYSRSLLYRRFGHAKVWYLNYRGSVSSEQVPAPDTGQPSDQVIDTCPARGGTSRWELANGQQGQSQERVPVYLSVMDDGVTGGDPSQSTGRGGL